MSVFDCPDCPKLCTPHHRWKIQQLKEVAKRKRAEGLSWQGVDAWMITQQYRPVRDIVTAIEELELEEANE